MEASKIRLSLPRSRLSHLKLYYRPQLRTVLLATGQLLSTERRRDHLNHFSSTNSNRQISPVSRSLIFSCFLRRSTKANQTIPRSSSALIFKYILGLLSTNSQPTPQSGPMPDCKGSFPYKFESTCLLFSSTKFIHLP
jgi:hypothetical protein